MPRTDGPDNSATTLASLVTLIQGCVLTFAGAVADIPAKWQLSDGTNGTHNLSDSFILHADADSGGTNDVGDTGGSNTIAEANLPIHAHTIAHTHVVDFFSGGGAGTTPVPVPSDGSTFSSQNKTTSLQHVSKASSAANSGNVGSGTAFKPKYYALAFIQYVG